jgi:hypothetical protein
MKNKLANITIKNHIIAHIFNGRVEKFIMPSIANFIILFKLYQVSQNSLFGLSNSTKLVLYHIQANIPLIYLSFSFSVLNISSTFLSISLKSQTSLGIFISDIFDNIL